MAVIIATRLDDGDLAFTVNTEERMAMRNGFHRVHGNGQAAIGTVLKPDGHGQTGTHFAVGLRLGRSGADRGPGYGILQILR